MQKWFSASFGDNENENYLQQTASSSSSLLSDWNSYAATRSSEESSSGSGALAGVFDIESAVRSANDTVSGTFNVLDTQGDISNLLHVNCVVPQLAPGRVFPCETHFHVLKGDSLIPKFVSRNDIKKFAICFTVGYALIIGSFFALRGPKNQFTHISSMERLPFTLGFLGSMVGTIYVSMVLHSYVLSVLFSVLQVLALAYYAISYFPGGSAGLKFLSSSLTSSILKCFGR